MFKRFSNPISGDFFQKAKKWSGNYLVFCWQIDPSQPARMAIIIKKDHQKLASARHLLKRRIRQVLTEWYKNIQPGLQLVVVSTRRCGILNQPNWQAKLTEEVRGFSEKLAKLALSVV